MPSAALLWLERQSLQAGKFPTYCFIYGRAIAKAVSRRLPTTPAGFQPRSGHVGFVVDKVALGQVYSEYFGFPCQFSFHRLLHNHHLSSGVGTIGQLMADVPSGLSLTPPQETKHKNYCFIYKISLTQYIFSSKGFTKWAPNFVINVGMAIRLRVKPRRGQRTYFFFQSPDRL
jgi:hypothetical protein